MDSSNTSFGHSTGKSGMTRIKWVIISIIIIAALAAIVGFVVAAKIVRHQLQTTTAYQAVFLTNGQVYFGKLSESEKWIVLSDIYYLQATQPLQQTGSTETPASASQPNIQLIKLGSELHGPQDQMNIERDKVLFWENMKDDSKVVQAIHQYKSK